MLDLARGLWPANKILIRRTQNRQSGFGKILTCRVGGMKHLLRNIYLKITQPLYERLSRDLSIAMSTQASANGDFLERFVSRVLDDLLVLSVQVEEQGRVLRQLLPAYKPGELPGLTLADLDLTDGQISVLASELASAVTTVEIAEKYKISPLVAARLKARLNGCDVRSIQEIRWLDQENARLTGALAHPNKAAALAELDPGDERPGQ